MNKKILKWVIPVLVVAAAGVFFFAHNEKNNGPVSNFSPEFEEGQTQETSAPSEAKGIKIPGYSVIPVTADTKEISVDLFNPEENNVYFQITFTLKDTNEQIFQSKLLKPGQHLYKITLDKALPAGEHPVTIQYETFSTDESYTPKNGATVDCIIRAAK